MPGYHLRLEHTQVELDKAIGFLKDISGSVAVYHMRGKRGEHPHLHVWYPLDTEIKSEAFLARLKKQSAFSAYSGNKQWSVRLHNDFINWWHYVWKGDKGQWCPYNNIDGLVKPDLVVATEVNDKATEGSHTSVVFTSTPVKPNRKKPMKVQFIEYLQKEEQWVLGERFRSQHAWDPKRVYAECAKQCSEFWEDAFTVPEGERMVRHAAFKFSDDALRVDLIENTTRSILKRIMG